MRYDFPPSFDLAMPGRELVETPELRVMTGLINALWLMNRSLVSDGYDEALEYIRGVLPLEIHTFPSGSEVGTWITPKKWVIRGAQIRSGSEVICDFKDHPLHVVSYSPGVEARLSKSELSAHLHFNTDRPAAIPFVYKYYRPEWGFCLPYNSFCTLRSGMYDVAIDAAFEDGDLKVGECVLPGASEESILVCAHLCHPGQVNDDLTGVAAAVTLFRRLAELPSRRYTYRLILCPENIGSIAYLTRYRREIKSFKSAIFLEMVGNKNHLVLQRSRTGQTLFDDIAEDVVADSVRTYGRGDFRRVICNDEINLNGPGIDIPTISLTRWPYPEYHSSDDTPAIVSYARLQEVVDICWRLISTLERNYYPTRKYFGNVFLTRYGLYEDLNADDTVERMLLSFEGDLSVFEIAKKLNVSFDRAFDYAVRFSQAGLLSLEPSPKSER